MGGVWRRPQLGARFGPSIRLGLAVVGWAGDSDVTGDSDVIGDSDGGWRLAQRNATAPLPAAVCIRAGPGGRPEYIRRVAAAPAPRESESLISESLISESATSGLSGPLSGALTPPPPPPMHSR